MKTIIDWVEVHPITIDILKWILVILGAWILGVFRFIRKFTLKPIVRIQSSASYIFIEKNIEYNNCKNYMIAAYFLNISVINRTKEPIVVDSMILSYETINTKRSFKQELVRIAYPLPPRKVLGNSIKLHSVFYTNYSEEIVSLPPVSPRVEPGEINSGYILFVSCTYGDYNILIKDNHSKIKLTLTLSNGIKIETTNLIRITEDKASAEEFCPTILDFIHNENTWNHEPKLYE